LGIWDCHVPRSRVEQLRATAASSPGVFKKFNLTHSKSGLLYVKSGQAGSSFRSLQPVTEKICSEIGLVLGFDIVDTRLWSIDRRLFSEIEDHSETEINDLVSRSVPPDVETFSFDKTMRVYNRALVSVTNSFITPPENFNTCEKLFSGVYSGNLYSFMTEHELFQSNPHLLSSLHQMMLFDFIVHNNDRHTKNFGYLSRKGETVQAPLYDHGFSLLSDLTRDEIEDDIGDLWGLGRGKPFGSLLANFEKIEKSSVKEIDFSISAQTLMDIIDPYKPVIGEMRTKLMKETVRRKWTHAKKILS